MARQPIVVDSALGDPERLAALEATELLDASADEAFDGLTRLATRALSVPVALVSLVTPERQFFASCIGLPEPYASTRETPLSHSFCQHVVASGMPLLVEDARERVSLRDNLAIPDLGVIAYAGMPLRTNAGHVLGSFCAIDHRPRTWSEGDIAALADLTDAAMSELELRRLTRRQRRAQHQLGGLTTAALAINSQQSLSDMLQTVTEQAAEVVGARQAMTRVTAGELWSQPITSVARSGGGEPLEEDPDAQRGISAPLVSAAGERLGLIQLADRLEGEFTTEDLGVLVQLAHMASVAIENARLYERQTKIARTLQRRLLPSRLPEIPWLEAAVRYRAAGEGVDVGGDFYDLIATGEDSCVAVIGDVVGKGPEAASLTGVSRHTLRTLAHDGMAPIGALARLNDAIHEDTGDTQFCTAVYARLEATGGGVRACIASGGHPLPILLRADGGHELVGGRGMLLGWREGPELDEQAADLVPGDVLILFTDGLTDTARAQIDDATVVQAATAAGSREPADIAAALEALALETAGGELSDDLALLVLRVPPR